MEPQNNDQVTIEDSKNALHKVTPLSKYLAMIIFIASPFIGGWIGYQYAPEKVVEVERVVEISSDSAIGELEENVSIRKGNSETDYSADDYKKYEYYMQQTGLEYDIATNTIRVRDRNNLLYVHEGIQTIDKVMVNENDIDVTILPYLTILSSTTNKLFLTRHCFAETMCGHSDLYEFDLSTLSLSKMKIGKFYNQFRTEISPYNDRFILSSPFSIDLDPEDNYYLYALDLYTDKVITLDSEKIDSGFYFCAPMSFTCELRVNWISEKNIEVSLYGPDNSTETRLYSLNF